ncbi:MAG: helix-turn-helix transcriptional regulator [Thermodesulfobacteriota bacterium]|nr:helix-turn-helix transcriptional regulator [Thermodesulfobacteriota bacterium]
MIDHPINNKFVAALQDQIQKYWRRQKGSLGIKAGVDGSTITRILNKETHPKYDTQIAIIEALKASYVNEPPPFDTYEDFIDYGEQCLSAAAPKKQGLSADPNELYLIKLSLSAIRQRVNEELDALLAQLSRLLPDEQPDPCVPTNWKARRAYYHKMLNQLDS